MSPKWEKACPIPELHKISVLECCVQGPGVLRDGAEEWTGAQHAERVSSVRNWGQDTGTTDLTYSAQCPDHVGPFKRPLWLHPWVCYEGTEIRYRAAVTAHNLGNFSWSHWGMTLAGMTVTAREIGSLGIFRKFRNNGCYKWQCEKRMKPEVLAGIFGKDKWQREVHPLTPGGGPGLWGKRKGWVWVW